MKKIISVLILACVSAPPACAEPGTPSGTGESGMTACVYEYKGEVGVFEPGGRDWDTLKSAVQLKEGTRLRTGNGAWCRILAGDGTFINLYENSETVVETLKLSKDSRDYGFNFVKGRILWMAAKLKNVRSRFSIRTPSAVCAVRGTDFFIGVSSAATEIGLFEGQLDVQNGEKNAQLSAGNEAVAAPGSDVTVNAYFSRTMKAEQRRYLRLKKYTEDLRQKLAARDGFIDEFVKGQQEKLQEFENRRRDKLNRRKE